MARTFTVAEAIDRLAPHIIKTPLTEIEALSERVNKRVFLKLESMQRTGAFKFRGAMNYMLTLPDVEGARGIITASSGNHGLGMSLAGKLRGLNCTVVMPASAPQVKQDRARHYGATVILAGTCYDEAQEHAKTLANAQGLTYVPSFNHPAIIAGQGTILQEIVTELPEAEVVVVPVGGGGLISGLLLAREELGLSPAIMGVEPYGAACMFSSLQAGHLTTLAEMKTIADGVAVRTPGDLNFAIVDQFRPDMLRVTDQDVLAAQRFLLHEAKLLVETAGAVSVAALLGGALQSDASTVVCVVSGANFDIGDLRGLM